MGEWDLAALTIQSGSTAIVPVPPIDITDPAVMELGFGLCAGPVLIPHELSCGCCNARLVERYKHTMVTQIHRATQGLTEGRSGARPHKELGRRTQAGQLVLDPACLHPGGALWATSAAWGLGRAINLLLKPRDLLVEVLEQRGRVVGRHLGQRLRHDAHVAVKACLPLKPSYFRLALTIPVEDQFGCETPNSKNLTRFYG